MKGNTEGGAVGSVRNILRKVLREVLWEVLQQRYCLHSMCVVLGLNIVYQGSAIVVRYYCCSISHSTLNNRGFPSLPA